MKISFCLSYSSLLFPINTFTICYAVVNLRFLHLQMKFWALSNPCNPLKGWWAQMDFLAFGCFATKWPRHFIPTPYGVWWAQMDSDHRPHAYQACALTS